jgi:hypothetical protein
VELVHDRLHVILSGLEAVSVSVVLVDALGVRLGSAETMRFVFSEDFWVQVAASGCTLHHVGRLVLG